MDDMLVLIGFGVFMFLFFVGASILYYVVNKYT